MNPGGASPGSGKRRASSKPELDLASRVADDAAEEALEAEAVPPDEQRTLAKGADPDYQEAIEDIALLVAMRREVSIDALLDDASVSDLDARRRRREVSRPTLPAGSDGRDRSDGEGALGFWGPFELLERVGGGASGEVYKVRDRHLKNHVALKLFHEERVASVELDTLLVEGRQHALVKHPNIAVIHGADENEGRVGIWMEYIDGSTLQTLVESQGTFGAAEAVVIARELCSALAAVHRQGLTHGDIKAQNVMREKGGRIVLMDFSSSRAVELDDESKDRLVGTPIYMAPELFDGSPSDFRSDIYALGVLLFFLVTGRHPFEADNLRALKEVVRTRRPLLLDDLRPDLPTGFIRAVSRATAKAPEERFQSAGEFQSALRDADAATNTHTIVTERPGETPSRVAPAPDITPLVRAARVVTVSILVASFLAVVGFANEFQFNVALHVPDNLTNYSPVNAVVVGLRALVISLFVAIVELLPFLVLWGLVTTLGRGTANAVRQFFGRQANKLRQMELDKLSTIFTLVCVLTFTAAFVYFGELMALLVALAESDTTRGLDVSILKTSDFYVDFVLSVTQIAVIMAVGWVVLFKILAPPGRLTPTARVMKWIGASAILISLVVMASPWRLVWKNESLPVWIGETKGYVVAEKGDEWFVYVPVATNGQRHVVIDSNDPRISRVGENLENVFADP